MMQGVVEKKKQSWSLINLEVGFAESLTMNLVARRTITAT